MLFCATRDSVRRLHAVLQERGFGVVALSGEHSQSERNQALQALRDRRARVCVATDVAARGIDLPSLSLVIHVELPRDAETLQHRSGRTGRAGKKGTAVLIVPYPRRRRVEGMLRDAKIQAEWIAAPTLEAIRAQDRERLISALLQLWSSKTRTANLLPAAAGTLARGHRSRAGSRASCIHAAGRRIVGEYTRSPPRRSEGAASRGVRGYGLVPHEHWTPSERRPALAVAAAVPPGHITRNEVGAIRIGANETHFQVPRAIATASRKPLSARPRAKATRSRC
jgi:ATP-dependent RNA helicase DeaD